MGVSNIPGGEGQATSAAHVIASGWIDDFGAALERGDPAAVADLFLLDGWWRDLLTFTWDFRTFHGVDQISRALSSTLSVTGARNPRLRDDKPPVLVETGEGSAPDAKSRWVQAFFDFETTVAHGYGFVRLKPAGGNPESRWKAWTVLTAMEDLKGFEEKIGSRRIKGVEHGEHRASETWLDRRIAKQEFIEQEPQVLIVGAGQGGLAVAARLGLLGVNTLVIEKNDRVGDNWRNRYRSLVLHAPVYVDHMPLMPFPTSWPLYTPKDKLADWLESYASAMDLNVWTTTTLQKGRYDHNTRRWTIDIGRPDGSHRTLHPHHVILATGLSGVPNIPEFEGANEFEGTVVHSSAHQSGGRLDGKRAIVVGSSNSAHDIAHDLYEQGADVTMVQRSSTYIMSSENGFAVTLAGRFGESAPPLEDVDRMTLSIPNGLLPELLPETTRRIAELDKDLLAGLKKQGFKVNFGIDGGGLPSLYLRRGGGYYINVGASEAIVAGKIKIKQGIEIERFTKDSIVFFDGTSLPADIVVLATGYQNMRESARKLFGDDVADKCTPVWGFDDESELRSVWRRSGHDGLWFMAGGLLETRLYSKYLALQIKAHEEGLLKFPWPQST
jgi:cation diffusion facilitator CzcD-associated flavoprotein CzcO